MNTRVKSAIGNPTVALVPADDSVYDPMKRMSRLNTLNAPLTGRPNMNGFVKVSM